MTKYSLRARMMILILAPTLMIGLLLSTFFVIHRYNQLQFELADAGASIIEPLAISSAWAMMQHQQDSVRKLVNVLHRRHSSIVRAISIYDAQNRLFVTTNPRNTNNLMHLSDDAPVPNALTQSRSGNALILHMPISSDGEVGPDSALASSNSPIGYIAIELALDSVKLQQYREIFTAGLLMLLCLVIAMLFAWRLMHDVTTPIRHMVNTVDRIRRGQLDSRVEGFMLGELDMLKNGINSMAMSLTAYHEEMQQNIDQATYDLRETLEQMEIQNVELDLAKKRAQEAARIKSEFLANMSHELRTPLNGVIGFTRQTLKTALTPTQADYLHTIERSANNLLTIINDVLDFSKLEAGKLVLENVPFSLHVTIDEVVLLLAHTAHEKGLELTLNIQPDIPEQYIGDPMRLQQIITNLLGNAIKFTEKGNIDIRLEKRRQDHHQVELALQIQDSGIGITGQQQSQLFQAFRQADASISRRHGGTGLGLVITQRLVREMGGDIRFDSQPGKGTTFWFNLRLTLNPNALSTRGANDALRGRRLAYVEENPAAAQATLDILHDTPLAVSYSPALDQLPDQPFDVLLFGVPVAWRNTLIGYMPALREACKRAPCVILAIPSLAQLDAEQLKSFGIHSCLVKPISACRLLPLLQSGAFFPHAGLPSPHPSPLTAAPAGRLPLTVMAVDDNPANLKLIGTLLDELVDKVILCDNGAQAVALARRGPLDIILMDIQMPEMDGIRAAELIHQLPLHALTPIVAVTAHSLNGECDSLQQAGMADYLAKPIDEQMLRNLLARHLARKSAVPPIAPSLDWELALSQAANKSDLARDLLRMLLDFLPQVRERVGAILNGQPDDGIVDLIHKLHGSSSYSGVPRLKQLCNQLEQQLRQGVSLNELEPEWLELLDEIDNVTAAARPWLST
ncbi:two-component sensor histidine kinase BarA [Affinibrenneria salicis]|uniref:histidine kinase n=1 Tax=Affinibrenneria salicis TaxID=2590031 RepID=A0A5J5G5L4_9GAMM|nr:two-component sensor histidine kinase BarA [Affinibrenneria salicis]KAA9002499.1 two-component sensor histidine kinase BarA [Affinibrenneria salicis]KAA9003213.1 two-component sensor histidine kinase BarA [Affinibrenneria salicis]